MLEFHGISHPLHAISGDDWIHAVTTQRPLDNDSAIELFTAAVDGLMKLAASGTRTLIALLGVDDLVSTGVGRRPLDGVDELLWTFRGRLQHAIEEPGVLLAGSDIAGELTANRRAAFFGWGTTITLGVPARLEEAIAHHASYRQIARDLRSLHRLALPVALAIAQDQPPYGVDRFASGPNKALTRLHAAGLVVQHAPRSWRLTDPLFAWWLRENPVTSRPELGRPTLWVLRRAANRYLVADGSSLSHVRSVHRSSEAAQRARSRGAPAARRS